MSAQLKPQDSYRAGTQAQAGQASANEDHSLGGLLKQLAHEVPALMRNEVALAKSEMRESARHVGQATGTIALGGLIAQGGLVVLLLTVAYGLSQVISPFMAGLVTAGAALLIGGIMVASGRAALKKQNLKPTRTIESLEKDKDIITGGKHEHH